MAKLFFVVFEDAASVALGDKLQENFITIAGTSAQSVAIVGTSPKRKRVRIFCDLDCFVEWNGNPTATNDGLNGMPLGIENPEYLDVKSGDKIAVIAR